MYVYIYIYMTSAINPPAYKLRGLPVSVWFRFCTPETQKHAFLKNTAIREAPGRFREGKREGRNRETQIWLKHRNPGRAGKVPGRETGRQKHGRIDNAKHRSPGRAGKVPGRFREANREAKHSFVFMFLHVSGPMRSQTCLH